MNFQKSIVERIVLSIVFVVLFSVAVVAQNMPSVTDGRSATPKPVASGTNLYCAGYIQTSAISTENRIVGSNDEADRYNFAQNDFLYINMGRNKGVNAGDVFAVIRPRGHVKSKWSKKGDLGSYVQEVGALEVVKVNEEVSVARIKSSCDVFLLGDLVQLINKRTGPVDASTRSFDIFGDPSGKSTGRVIMARDNVEMIARDFIVYVDLGAEDNVTVGDKLTIFRPLGKGNITLNPTKESIGSKDYGYPSEIYEGGRFSNQSSRTSGEKGEGKEVTTAKAKEGRPFLRKIVGEAVVINVKERTATVVITRNAQEIHTGDWVEIQ